MVTFVEFVLRIWFAASAPEQERRKAEWLAMFGVSHLARRPLLVSLPRLLLCSPPGAEGE